MSQILTSRFRQNGCISKICKFSQCPTYCTKSSEYHTNRKYNKICIHKNPKRSENNLLLDFRQSGYFQIQTRQCEIQPKYKMRWFLLYLNPLLPSICSFCTFAFFSHPLYSFLSFSHSIVIPLPFNPSVPLYHPLLFISVFSGPFLLLRAF